MTPDLPTNIDFSRKRQVYVVGNQNLEKTQNRYQVYYERVLCRKASPEDGSSSFLSPALARL